MTTFSKVTGWIFGVFFALCSLLFIARSTVLASLMAVGAAVLLPPVRNFAFQKGKYTLPASARAVLAFVLFFASAYFLGAEVREAREKKLAAFRSNPEEVLVAVRAAVSSQDWKKVIATAQDYLPAKNAELDQLYQTAKGEQTKLDRAAIEEAAQPLAFQVVEE